MQLARVLVNWSGPSVKGLAVNVLHFAGDVGPPNPTAIQAAYAALAPVLGVGVSVRVANSGDVIEDTTGDIDSVWTGTVTTPTIGVGSADKVVAGAGMCVNWHTGGIVSGAHGSYKLKGRTFLVPLNPSYFENDGTPSTNLLTAVDDFATALQSSGPLAVWKRPHTVGGANGNSYGVIAHKIADRASFLTSRRS